MRADTWAQAMVQVTENSILVDAAQAAKGAELRSAEVTVVSNPHMAVVVNGKSITGQALIDVSDHIEVVLRDTPPSRTATVTVTEDGLRATLHIEYEAGIHRQLIPRAPSARAVIEVTETVYPYEPFSVAELASFLTDYGIVTAVDWDAIQALWLTGQSGSCLCAVGQAPVPGKPEHFELITQDSGDLRMLGIVPIHPVMTVQAGATIAKRVPETPGTPGQNVFGQAVVPDPEATGLPPLGPGVEVDVEGVVRATRSGRVVHLSTLLDVVPSWEMESVRLSDGHVVFDGDVIVKGDVAEGVQITAGGSVFVSGVVTQATIMAQHGIVIAGACIGSRLSAGLQTEPISELCTILTSLTGEFDAFVRTIEQLSAALHTRGTAMEPSRIARHVIDERYQSDPRWSERLQKWTDAHGGQTGVLLSERLHGLTRALTVPRITLAHSMDDWRTILAEMNQVLRTLPVGNDEASTIQVKNGQNCRLDATGSVIATGQGFYRCTIHAKDSIQATKGAGVILGCHVVGGNRVEAKEIGSLAEVSTEIEVRAEDATIKCGLIYPGTLLRHPSLRCRVDKEMRNAEWPGANNGDM